MELLALSRKNYVLTISVYSYELGSGEDPDDSIQGVASRPCVRQQEDDAISDVLQAVADMQVRAVLNL